MKLWTGIPISIPEAGKILKKSPQMVNIDIARGKYRSAYRVGAKLWILDKREIEALKPSE